MKKRNDDFDEEHLTGFRLEHVKGYVAGNMSSMKMYLPDSEDLDMFLLTREALAVEERDAAYEIALKNERAIRKAKEEKESQDQERLREVQPTPYRSSSASGSSRNDLDPDKERKKLHDKFIAESGVPDQTNKFQVYEWDEPLVLIKNGRNSTADRELRARNEKMYFELREKGNFRNIYNAPTEKAIEQLELLRTQQPHFGDVINLIREQFLLAKARNTLVRIPPILIYGEAGIGKTHFSQMLAEKVLGTTMHRHAFDSASTEATLIGSDRHWANTTCGIVFDMVVMRDCGNPILLLDEIDKQNYVQGLSTKDPLAPLHTLLEPVTSRRIKDASVEMTFDASVITYVATANNPARVPQTIRSRFIEFHVKQPDAGQALQLAKAVCDAIAAEMMLPNFASVTTRIIALIAHLSAREMGQVLRRAYASAVSNDRLYIDIRDLPNEVLVDDPEYKNQTNKFH